MDNRSHDDRWKHRRRMAYMACVSGLAFPLMILLTNSVELDKIAMPFYTFATMIVVAYIGGAVVDDNNFKDIGGEKK